MEPSTSETIHSGKSESKNAVSTLEHMKSKHERDQSEVGEQPAAKRKKVCREREKHAKELERNDVERAFAITEKPIKIVLENLKHTKEMLPITIPIYHVVKMKGTEGCKRKKRTSKHKQVTSTISNNEPEFVGIVEDAELPAESSGNIASNSNDLLITESCNKKEIESKELRQLAGDLHSIISTRESYPNNEPEFVGIVEDTEILADNRENIMINHSDLQAADNYNLKKIGAKQMKQCELITSKHKNDLFVTPKFVATEPITENNRNITTNHSALAKTESCSTDLKKIKTNKFKELVRKFELKIKQKSDTPTAINNELEFSGIVETAEPFNESGNHYNLPTTTCHSKDSRRIEVQQTIVMKSGLTASKQVNNPSNMPNTEAAENSENFTSGLFINSYSKDYSNIEEKDLVCLVRTFDLNKTIQENKNPPNECRELVTDDRKKYNIRFPRFHPVYDCLVLMCYSSNADLEKGVTFHSLAGKRIKEWLKILHLNRSDEWAARQTICSKHFVPDDFTDSTTRLKLRTGVLPKKFLTGLPECRVVLKRMPSDVLQYHLKHRMYKRLRDIAVRLKDDLVKESDISSSIAHEQSDLLHPLIVPDQLNNAGGDDFIRQLHNYSYNPIQFTKVSAEFSAKLTLVAKEFNESAKIVDGLRSHLQFCKQHVRRLMKLKRITPEENPHIFNVLMGTNELWSDGRRINYFK